MNTTTSEIRHLESETLPSSAPGIQENDEVSVLEILIVLARRKWLILKFTVGFGVLALVVSLLLPKKYTAITTVMPPQQNSSLTSALMSQVGGSLGSLTALAGSSIGLKNPNDMYVAMFKSRTVEDAMIQRFGLMDEYHEKYMSTTRKAFESHATVEATTKDNLIHISVEDRNAKRAAEMANAYVEEYRRLSQHLAIGEAAQRRLFFEQQLEQAKNNLADAEEALKETEQKTGMIQLDSQARALIESAVTLRAQIAAKEVQLQSIKTYATSENSDVIQTQQELDSLRTQLAKLGGNVDDSAGLIIPKGQMTQGGIEYVRRYRDVKYYETIFEILARQFELAKLDEAKEGALIQVVDLAIVPDYKSFPKRGIITIVAAAVGLIIGIFAAFFRESMERLEQDPEQSERLRILRKLIWARKTA
ncbi:chain length determinant family protein [Alloacidobacterium dinghuense]|uniref:Chain length determinant family protein n=1 Tax=Alloacidobacterium dinghuense TaxID=2763107 RepID=A0A7G8BIJ0_9BACT|nr:Wzz/FepE/Etk N-terminal domain-containing protein [Alloacidobacterium dinghuense]QNI32360.1 chain length determinant family protein [Alloacidobacterium dinghuense]